MEHLWPISPSVHLVCSLEEESTSVDYTSRKFWEIETIAEDVSTNSRRLAEVQDQTQKTTAQLGSRYQVRLPWKQEITKPTGSYDLALRRLHMTEKRLERNPELKRSIIQPWKSISLEGMQRRLKSNQPKRAGICHVILSYQTQRTPKCE